MPAKPLFFFMATWLVLCAAGGASVAGWTGAQWGAGLGLLATIPMIMGAGVRQALR